MYKDKAFMKEMSKPIPKERLIEYVDISSLDAHQFRKKFEHMDRPVMIRGVAKKWKANKNWTPATFEKRMADVKFRVSGTETKVKHYMRYARENKDDNPLYLFDYRLDDGGREVLLDEYTVPAVFKYDYFGVMGTARRPPFRWFVVGPERTGTVLHLDPLGTSAWNTLTHGRTYGRR